MCKREEKKNVENQTGKGYIYINIYICIYIVS